MFPYSQTIRVKNNRQLTPIILKNQKFNRDIVFRMQIKKRLLLITNYFCVSYSV